jgi:hypothetical protein
MIGLLLGTAMLIPSVAQAQERGRERGDRGGEHSWQRGGGPARETMGGDDARAAIARGREAAREVERPAPVMQPQPRAAEESRRQWQGGNREWNRGDRGAGEGQRDWARGRADDGRQRDTMRTEDGRRRDGNRDWGLDRSADGQQRWSTDRRDWDRDGRVDNRERRDWNRSWTSDRNRWHDHDGRGDRRWDRDWRNDRRYAWQDYRRSNRHIYRLPRYQPPRWGYSYRRWSPGFRWDSWYYSRSYWIADPWYYRLPPAYGDYRWVRYYDDAVLVDIRTGEIIDIIYAFFF